MLSERGARRAGIRDAVAVVETAIAQHRAESPDCPATSCARCQELADRLEVLWQESVTDAPKGRARA